jgi:uncharacterized membrane protein
MSLKNWIIGLTIVGGATSLLLLTWFPYQDALRMAFGSLYTLFIPGWVWSYLFFKKNDIDVIERIAWGLGLSMLLIIVSFYYANTFGGLTLNLQNSLWGILAITGVGGLFNLVYLRK